MNMAEISEWRDIESAPHDGTEVVLRVRLRAGVPGRCLVGHWMPGGHCIDDQPPIEAGWYFWNGTMFDLAAQPLEWAPLPGSSFREPEPVAYQSAIFGGVNWGPTTKEVYDEARANNGWVRVAGGEVRLKVRALYTSSVPVRPARELS